MALKIETPTISLLVTIACAGASLVGCSPEARFRQNIVQLHKASKPFDKTEEEDGEMKVVEPFEFTRTQIANLDDILIGLFGTPDEPNFPDVFNEAGDRLSVVDSDRLAMAAGPVGKEEDGTPRGLYRQHCSHCHGITGDGQGPTAAFLNPYPRDYQLGAFKFKATKKGAKPTDEDLLRVLREGVPGTAMPSFRVLSNPELQTLIDYVKYLSIRGEVERGLIRRMGVLEEEKDEPGDVPLLVDLSSRNEEGGRYQADIAEVEALVTQVVQAWSVAEENITEVPPRPASWSENPEELREQIIRGRELFFTSKFNCFSCHGETALGDGQTDFYDDWAVDIFGKEPTPEEIREYVQLGALEPRTIKPRNLRLGVYRGGRRPIDLYRRVANGIEGTPMPDISTSIPPEDVWAVIEYVRQLPYESISQPPESVNKPLNEEPVFGP